MQTNYSQLSGEPSESLSDPDDEDYAKRKRTGQRINKRKGRKRPKISYHVYYKKENVENVSDFADASEESKEKGQSKDPILRHILIDKIDKRSKSQAFSAKVPEDLDTFPHPFKREENPYVRSVSLINL